MIRARSGAVVLLLLAACAHEVDRSTQEDGAAVFLSEGDELQDQLTRGDADGYLRTPLVPTPAVFSRVGVRFDAVGPVAVEVRASTDQGASFTAWQATTLTFSESPANNAFADVGDALEQAGARATHVQLRFMAPVESALSFLAVEAFDLEAQRDAGTSSGGAQALAADGVALPRAQWGARPRSCNAAQHPERITIHHTETPNADQLSTAARLRQMQNYHVDVRGWCDIGYHFLVGKDGNVYAGRAEDVRGAHVAGNNADNVGIAFVGSYHGGRPSAAMESAAARIMAALADEWGITLSRSTVKSHRELGSSDCPGNALQARLAGLVAEARSSTPQPPPSAPPPTTPPPSTPPAASDPWAGLTQGNAQIPRAGLSNPTLQNTLGLQTEPYGTTTTVDGRQWVQGKVSWFGGPDDTGVGATETGSVTSERLRELNDPVDASSSTVASRPEDFYFVAMRWNFSATPRNTWRDLRLLLKNPANGHAVVVRPVDWGPNTSTRRIVDVSPRTITDLDADTDDTVLVAFAAPGTPLGVVTVASTPPVDPPVPPPASGSHVIPVGATWQWQLSGTLDTGVDVEVFDLDLFDVSASTIASLKAQGRTVICYFSAGTWESWRPDQAALPASARGTSLDPPFSDELWLDTRNGAVRDVMRARLDLAAQKGCDAVEPDSVDGYTNGPGFPLTAATQLEFNRFLASEAHARGLGVGLKNDVDQLAELVGDFDWALNEECVANDECDAYTDTFIAAGKAVLHADYVAASQLASVCAVTQPLQLSTIVKEQMLGAARWACP